MNPGWEQRHPTIVIGDLAQCKQCVTCQGPTRASRPLPGEPRCLTNRVRKLNGFVAYYGQVGPITGLNAAMHGILAGGTNCRAGWRDRTLASLPGITGGSGPRPLPVPKIRRIRAVGGNAPQRRAIPLLLIWQNRVLCYQRLELAPGATPHSPCPGCVGFFMRVAHVSAVLKPSRHRIGILRSAASGALLGQPLLDLAAPFWIGHAVRTVAMQHAL